MNKKELKNFQNEVIIHNIQIFSNIMLVSFVISLIEINVYGQTVDLVGYYK